MLHVLDPHSNFYDPKAFAQIAKTSTASITASACPSSRSQTKRRHHVVVLAPFEGTPAYKAGIRPGDIIMSIDGKSAEGLDSAAVATMLKGPQGTHVRSLMPREGQDKPLTFDLIRDEIPRPSVDLAFLVKPGSATSTSPDFMETTSREVGDALDKFRPRQPQRPDPRSPRQSRRPAQRGSRRLRQVPQKGQIVVSQRGRAYPDQVYRANHGERGRSIPIVVLVNHGDRVRSGDRLRRAAGSRPRADRRRNHLRQGAGADRLPDIATTQGSRSRPITTTRPAAA